jgi:hypothetical protein
MLEVVDCVYHGEFKHQKHNVEACHAPAHTTLLAPKYDQLSMILKHLKAALPK